MRCHKVGVPEFAVTRYRELFNAIELLICAQIDEQEQLYRQKCWTRRAEVHRAA